MRVLVFKGKGLETTSNPFFMFVLFMTTAF
jgi:hypothetical protein